MDDAQALAAVKSFLLTLRSDPEPTNEDVAVFVQAVRAVIYKTVQPVPAAPVDPRALADAALDASIPVGDPSAPLLAGLIPADQQGGASPTATAEANPVLSGG